MENVITTLVIGKSGTGKSEFILSFIDEEQRKLIPASGEGQTTRTSMKYEIDFSQKRELTFDIELKSKKEFVDERMAVVERYFDDEENEIEDFKNVELYSTSIEDLKQELILDDAFFNYMEFDTCVNEVSKKFDEKFAYDFWKDLSEDIFGNSDEEKNDKLILGNDDEKTNENDNLLKDFNKQFRNFFEETYKLCKECIPLTMQRVIVKGTEKKDLELYLKVNENGKSYSALIKNISIVASGNETYRDIMERCKVDKLIFIDTYGLDHAEQLGDKMLEKRYSKLLREEYPEVKSVFYLRNISAPGSPSDLAAGITTLFKVEPSIVPYIIFTFWDKIYTSEDVDGYKKKKTYKVIDDIQWKIKKRLLKSKISQSLIDNRIKELLNTRIAYASVIEAEDNELIKSLKKCNKENIKIVLQSVRFKKHLGNQCVPIKKLGLDSDSVRNILSIDNLLQRRDLYRYPNATKGAIRKRIQPKIGRVLGFDSSTMESVLWTDIIAYDLNNRFCNVINNFKWEDYLVPQVGEENYPEIINAIEGIFVNFSRILYLGATNSVDQINTSCYGNLIIKSLYEEQKPKINSNNFPSVGEYLTEIYDFSQISEDAKKKIQEIIYKAYENYFIIECRKHNARVIAESISKDTTWNDKENMLKTYYSQYEQDDISDDEKMVFETYVSDCVVV